MHFYQHSSKNTDLIEKAYRLVCKLQSQLYQHTLSFFSFKRHFKTPNLLFECNLFVALNLFHYQLFPFPVCMFTCLYSVLCLLSFQRFFIFNLCSIYKTALCLAAILLSFYSHLRVRECCHTIWLCAHKHRQIFCHISTFFFTQINSFVFKSLSCFFMILVSIYYRHLHFPFCLIHSYGPSTFLSA